MAFTLHLISKYTYSLTLKGNDYAAKLSLCSADGNQNNFKVVDVSFVYEAKYRRPTSFTPTELMPSFLCRRKRSAI